jgi:hypothetical protein
LISSATIPPSDPGAVSRPSTRLSKAGRGITPGIRGRYDSSNDVSRISQPTAIITDGMTTATQPRNRVSSVKATASTAAKSREATTKQLIK